MMNIKLCLSLLFVTVFSFPVYAESGVDGNSVKKYVYLESGARCRSGQFYLAEAYVGLTGFSKKDDGSKIKGNKEEYLCYKEGDDLGGKELMSFEFFDEIYKDDARQDISIVYVPKGMGQMIFNLRHIR